MIRYGTSYFPTEQRVLTKDEYASLGYTAIRNVSIPSSKNGNFSRSIFPVYRAETKEEYAIDYGTLLVKVGATFATGGILTAGKTALGYTMGLFN